MFAFNIVLFLYGKHHFTQLHFFKRNKYVLDFLGKTHFLCDLLPISLKTTATYHTFFQKEFTVLLRILVCKNVNNSCCAISYEL